MYYPKSKIKTNQYTGGDEFIVKKTGVKYTGTYFSTYDGKYFTGEEPNENSEELSRIVKGTSNVSSFSPSFSYQIPTENDYNTGYFTRRFINRVNGNVETILEVNQDDYIRSLSDPLYIGCILDWKISGPVYDDLTNINKPIYGVADTNKRTLKLKERELPGISKYLNNLTQFYK